jgi:hypothetical protein
MSSPPLRCCCQPGQVLPYLLRLRLAEVHLLADTPDTRHVPRGQIICEQLGRRVPVPVEPGWWLGYAVGYRTRLSARTGPCRRLPSQPAFSMNVAMLNATAGIPAQAPASHI